MDEARASTSAAATISLSLPSSTSSVWLDAIVKSGRNRKSLVWEYFEYDPVTKKSVCQVLPAPSVDSSANDICGHIYSIPEKYPTNLRQHLKRAHPAEFSELSRKDEKLKKNRTKTNK